MATCGPGGTAGEYCAVAGPCADGLASSATLTAEPLAGARRAMTVMATTVAVATVGSRQKAQPIALPCASLVAHPVVAHAIQTKMALSVWMTCSLF